jgi:hypothetical protein
LGLPDPAFSPFNKSSLVSYEAPAEKMAGKTVVGEAVKEKIITSKKPHFTLEN